MRLKQLLNEVTFYPAGLTPAEQADLDKWEDKISKAFKEVIGRIPAHKTKKTTERNADHDDPYRERTTGRSSNPMYVYTLDASENNEVTEEEFEEVYSYIFKNFGRDVTSGYNLRSPKAFNKVFY
jgi:hypothetical protein